MLARPNWAYKQDFTLFAKDRNLIKKEENFWIYCLTEGIKTKRTGSTTYPFLIKLTNLTKPKLMKINV